jgi:hypothetical protein
VTANVPLSGVGIDTVRLAIRNTCWLSADDTPRRERLDDDGGGVVYVAHGYGMVEASLAKRENGDNVRAVEPEDVPDACERLVKDARSLLDVPDHPRITLSRLDICRDFTNVPRIPQVLGHLSSLVQPGGVAVSAMRSRMTAWETVYARRASWLARVYDKYSQCGLSNAAGVLRFELQINYHGFRSPWVKARTGDNLSQIDQVSRGLLDDLAGDRFRYLHYDTPWLTGRDLHDILTAVPDITPDQRARLLWHGTARERGSASGWNRATVAKQERDLNQIQATSATGTQRLDWSTGTVVATP